MSDSFQIGLTGSMVHPPWPNTQWLSRVLPMWIKPVSFYLACVDVCCLPLLSNLVKLCDVGHVLLPWTRWNINSHKESSVNRNIYTALNPHCLTSNKPCWAKWLWETTVASSLNKLSTADRWALGFRLTSIFCRLSALLGLHSHLGETGNNLWWRIWSQLGGLHLKKGECMTSILSYISTYICTFERPHCSCSANMWLSVSF